MWEYAIILVLSIIMSAIIAGAKSNGGDAKKRSRCRNLLGLDLLGVINYCYNKKFKKYADTVRVSPQWEELLIGAQLDGNLTAGTKEIDVAMWFHEFYNKIYDYNNCVGPNKDNSFDRLAEHVFNKNFFKEHETGEVDAYNPDEFSKLFSLFNPEIEKILIKLDIIAPAQ